MRESCRNENIERHPRMTQNLQSYTHTYTREGDATLENIKLIFLSEKPLARLPFQLFNTPR